MVAIDGPAGSGKSTVARALARRLGYRYLDTGAMYRAAAWKLDRSGIPPAEGVRLSEAISEMEIELRDEMAGLRVRVDGEDVTAEIRTPRVAMLASQYSALPAVRARLTQLQRRWKSLGGVVAEGRDTTTVVFPDAELKVFLDATPEERARRRLAEIEARGTRVDGPTVRQEIEARDRADAARPLAPLVRAPNALRIDTTGLPVEDVVERLAREAERLCSTGSANPRLRS